MLFQQCVNLSKQYEEQSGCSVVENATQRILGNRQMHVNHTYTANMGTKLMTIMIDNHIKEESYFHNLELLLFGNYIATNCDQLIISLMKSIKEEEKNFVTSGF